MRSAFRVLQAADFHLHQPLESAGVLPAELREIFNQARERAALKVFQTAMSSAVDLLLLTGPLALFEEEPRLACFLMEQFRQLQLHGVQVVWAAQNSGGLPNWTFDGHVERLVPGESLSLKSLRSGRRMHVAWLVGGQIPLSVTSEELQVTLQGAGQGLGIEYAIAGSTQPARHRTVSIQPDGPSDTAECGMWLTEAALGQIPTSSLLPTAPVHWAEETLELQLQTTYSELLVEMERRIARRQARQATELTLLQWQLTGQGPLWEQLAEVAAGRELLLQLRDSKSSHSRIWSWKVEFQPASAQIETWRQQSSVLAQSFSQQEQLTAADHLASSGGSQLPGHDHAHFGPSAGHAHAMRLRLVRALQNPGSESRADAG
ncbi:hypothetical protein [Planctomicrobium piriforme]|uniref:DNA repair exonuclease SbcCD nuclease subunit n=1 Tax=Planctomicrobium piriforme TaxID=1576369 RepID=A0A1I3C5Q0_9PLAN|nr:hypothetical protein [Planctomicrobium piriforme]SFH69864.1 hypothetical protein SAMN05421753_102124 [Planctomicrobium piriforme]